MRASAHIETGQRRLASRSMSCCSRWLTPASSPAKETSLPARRRLRRRSFATAHGCSSATLQAQTPLRRRASAPRDLDGEQGTRSVAARGTCPGASSPNRTASAEEESATTRRPAGNSDAFAERPSGSPSATCADAKLAVDRLGVQSPHGDAGVEQGDQQHVASRPRVRKPPRASAPDRRLDRRSRDVGVETDVAKEDAVGARHWLAADADRAGAAEAVGELAKASAHLHRRATRERLCRVCATPRRRAAAAPAARPRPRARARPPRAALPQRSPRRDSSGRPRRSRDRDAATSSLTRARRPARAGDLAAAPCSAPRRQGRRSSPAGSSKTL